MTQITLLITFNFGLQLLIDILSVTFVDRIGYRASMVIAHACAVTGLVFLIILPDICRSSFIGLLIAVAIYAVGGGLLEVLVSPIVEACPTQNKEKAMSLLHSFYCWGHVAVVLLSTVFFKFLVSKAGRLCHVYRQLFPSSIWFSLQKYLLLAKGGTAMFALPTLAGVIFPILLLAGIFLCRLCYKKCN